MKYTPRLRLRDVIIIRQWYILPSRGGVQNNRRRFRRLVIFIRCVVFVERTHCRRAYNTCTSQDNNNYGNINLRRQPHDGVCMYIYTYICISTPVPTWRQFDQGPHAGSTLLESAATGRYTHIRIHTHAHALESFEDR